MATDSLIQWTDHTYNLWRGCVKVAPECLNCYAEVDRSVAMHDVTWGSERSGGRRVVGKNTNGPQAFERLAKKLGRKQKVFVSSLSDVFEDWKGPMLSLRINGDEDRRENEPAFVYETLYRARADRLAKKIWYGSESMPDEELQPFVDRKQYVRVTMSEVRDRFFRHGVRHTPNVIYQILTKRPQNIVRFWPRAGKVLDQFENVWLGTSAGCPSTAAKLLPTLLQCHQSVNKRLFLSVGPLLQALDLSPYLATGKLGWVVIEGESNKPRETARPCQLQWIVDLVEQCRQFDVPCFVKQLGSMCFQGETLLDTHHPKGGDPSEWPIEFPRQLPSEML